MEVKSSSNLPPHDRGRSDQLGSASSGAGTRLQLSSKAPKTFAELLNEYVRQHGERIFLPRRRPMIVEPVTFRQLISSAELLANGLLALGLGHGDRVGLLAENRYEWLLADLATTWFGGIDVPRGSDTAPSEMTFILKHSGCRAAFVDDDKTALAVMEHRDQLPTLEHLIVLAEETTVPDVLTLTDLMHAGATLRDNEPDRLEQAAARLKADDLLTIVYTSGTTADPKGVMLTHGNVLSNMQVVSKVLHITSDDVFLSALPAWHMYERIMDYLALAAGGQLVYTDRRHIKDDLKAVAPTVFAAVPRIWETIHDNLIAHAHKKKGLGGNILRRVLASCRAVGGRKANTAQKLTHALAKATVLKKIVAITGGRLRLAVSGGGSLPRHVDETLLGIGLPLLNGYGLTETSPVAAVRDLATNQPGTIGPPIPGTEIKTRDMEGQDLPTGETGVLWIRGPQVMRGYYENPSKTREVLDDEGWFNSGDLGYVDDKRCVWITGRAKDTIVLASGENVEPEPIETALKTSAFIEQTVCLGQDQKSIGALLIVSEDCLGETVPRSQWDERSGMLRGKAVLELLRSEIDRLINRDTGFRPFERVASSRVLTEPLTTENGCLTHTLKLRRHVVQEKLGGVIAEMFER